jgi:glycogen synthase
MASWDKDVWTPENTEKINNVLRSQLSEDEIKASILETIRKTENRSAIIRGALKEGSDGLLRTTLGRLTDKEREELKKLLTPQDQATIEAVRSSIIY